MTTVTMSASTIVTPRIPRFFQSCHRSTFPSSWRLVERTRRRPTRTRNELNSSSSETWPSSSSSVHHPSLLLSPPPTRRWMSGTRSSSSSISSKGNGSTHVDDTEERRQDHRHCVDMVRTSDYEGYLCGLLMPSSAQEGYFALRAYNVEIATIKDGTSSSASSFSRRHGSFNTNNIDDNNPMGMDADPSFASRLRMRWWADAITEIFDDTTMGDATGGEDVNHVPNCGKELRYPNPHTTTTTLQSSSSLHGGLHNNPTLRSLRRAVHEHQLTHRFLRRMTEARELDLDVVQYDRLKDVAQYGEDTVSNMLYSTLECVGVRDEQTDMVASDIGVSLGILTALRSTGFRAARGECSMPRDLTVKHSVTMDTLWSALGASFNPNNNNTTTTRTNATTSSSSQEVLRNATLEMVDMATFHMQRARSKQSLVPKEARMCLLPAVCGIHYLNSLKECNYDVLHPSLVGGGGDGGDENASRLERSRRLRLMFFLGRTWLTGTF